MVLAGKTEVGSAEVQPARDSQLNATNCRWDGSYMPAVPFYCYKQFRALLCLKKPNKIACQRQVQYLSKTEKSLNCEVVLSNSR